MVFKSEKQRRGFFASVRGKLSEIRAQREVAFREKLERQKQRIADLQQSEAKLIDVEREKLKFEQQRAELRTIQAQEAQIKKKIFEASRAGRLVAVARPVARKAAKRFVKSLQAPKRRKKQKRRQPQDVGPFGL